MRTTIEMKPTHRAKVVEMAAIRGETGFSSIVADALDLYLEAQKERTEAIRKALALKSSFSDEEAGELRLKTREIRDNWR